MHGKEQSGGGRDDEMLSSVVVVVVGRGWTSLAQGCSRLARSPFGPQLAGCPRGFGNAPTLQWRELPAEPCALVSRAAGGGPVAVLHNPGGLLEVARGFQLELESCRGVWRQRGHGHRAKMTTK